MNILETIAAASRVRAESDKRRGLLPPPAQEREPFLFEKRLREPGLSFICEVKRASPSKGLIAEDFPYTDIALDYESAGADAVSVLTEPEYFKGSDQILREIRDTVTLPLLRKDFTVDPFQIEQARALGADAVLLICAILTPRQLREYMAVADSFGLSCLVEAHDENELKTALDAGARMVGVNNRDLRTFEVDITTSVRLRGLAPKDVIFVAESGIKTPADVALLREHGVNAALVGETLMRAPDKKEALQSLRGRL